MSNQINTARRRELTRTADYLLRKIGSHKTSICQTSHPSRGNQGEPSARGNFQASSCAAFSPIITRTLYNGHVSERCCLYSGPRQNQSRLTWPPALSPVGSKQLTENVAWVCHVHSRRERCADSLAVCTFGRASTFQRIRGSVAGRQGFGKVLVPDRGIYRINRTDTFATSSPIVRSSS